MIIKIKILYQLGKNKYHKKLILIIYNKNQRKFNRLFYKGKVMLLVNNKIHLIKKRVYLMLIINRDKNSILILIIIQM